MVPDARDTVLLAAIDGYLSELEKQTNRRGPRIYLIPVIESAAGLENAREIAACRRVMGLAFGVEDFMVDQGGEPDPALLDHACLRIATAARASGRMVLAVPESLANLHDMDRFRAAAMRAKAMGAEAGFAVHPRQVQVLNDCFTPTELEVAHARRVIEAAERAEEAGSGVFELDGRMIDLPIVVRARRLLDRAESLGLFDNSAS